MNKFIDFIISSLKYICKKIKLYIIAFYNETYLLINNNFTLSKIYKPIIKDKVSTNKELQETLNALSRKHKKGDNDLLKLENENALLQSKISIIEDLITKRHD